MTTEHILLILGGFAAGFGLGWVQAWRHARTLEHHGVRLVDWDTTHIDFAAKPTTPAPMRVRSINDRL